jgi:GNAT superfamily N-acetyltransferase
MDTRDVLTTEDGLPPAGDRELLDNPGISNDPLITTSPPPLSIRQATPSDLPSLIALWDATRGWLRSREINQFQYAACTSQIEADIAAGICWVVLPAAAAAQQPPPSQLAATVVLTDSAGQQGPQSPWVPGGARVAAHDDGLYVRRLLVHPTLRGRGLGDAVLAWAGRKARARGRSALRLAAWTKNEGLHRYYLTRGFELVKMVDYMMVGAFFEREIPEEEDEGEKGGVERSLVLREVGPPVLVEVCSEACLCCAVKRLHEKLVLEEPERCDVQFGLREVEPAFT